MFHARICKLLFLWTYGWTDSEDYVLHENLDSEYRVGVLTQKIQNKDMNIVYVRQTFLVRVSPNITWLV